MDYTDPDRTDRKSLFTCEFGNTKGLKNSATKRSRHGCFRFLAEDDGPPYAEAAGGLKFVQEIFGEKNRTGKEHFRFFETVCLNRGWTTKLFSDRQKALDWLLTRSD